MNKLILLTAFFSQMSFAAAPDLFHYTVYSKEGIDASCSDYLGNTASGGDINLYGFLIHSTDSNLESQSCVVALDSATKVNYTTGRIEDRDANTACVGAPVFTPDNMTAFAQQVASVAPVAALNAQMDQLSASLAARIANVSIRQRSGTFRAMRQAPAQKVISIVGSANSLVVLNITDAVVDFEGYGIRLSGGVKPENIVWNFPNATSLIIANSGMDSSVADYGIPGTVLAPNAVVKFHEARITGALYAKRIDSSIPLTAQNMTCNGYHGGQVNPACLWSPVPGIGCEDTSGQHQHQHN